jgi:hypothetical protein
MGQLLIISEVGANSRRTCEEHGAAVNTGLHRIETLRVDLSEVIG